MIPWRMGCGVSEEGGRTDVRGELIEWREGSQVMDFGWNLLNLKAWGRCETCRSVESGRLLLSRKQPTGKQGPSV